jgi:hypothetical protein
VSASRIRVPEPLRATARLARRLGWRLSRSGTGHLRWESPDGAVVFTTSTPGDRRSTLNDRAELRRAGLRTETS